MYIELNEHPGSFVALIRVLNSECKAQIQLVRSSPGCCFRFALPVVESHSFKAFTVLLSPTIILNLNLHLSNGFSLGTTGVIMQEYFQIIGHQGFDESLFSHPRYYTGLFHFNSALKRSNIRTKHNPRTKVVSAYKRERWRCAISFTSICLWILSHFLAWTNLKRFRHKSNKWSVTPQATCVYSDEKLTYRKIELTLSRIEQFVISLGQDIIRKSFRKTFQSWNSLRF